MNETPRQVIWIIIALLVIGGAYLLFSQQDNKGTSESKSDNNLYSEQTITHGHGLAVDVQDPLKLYIATHHGLLLLQKEQDLYRVGKSKDDYMGFSVHPTDPNVLFSSGHSSTGGNIGVQRSEDGGVTWNTISKGVQGPVDFHAMTVSPVQPSLMYGWYQGNLQRSTDGGTTWEIVNREITPIYLAADTADENVVYAATAQGVLVSADRGESWETLSPELEGGVVSVIAVQPDDENTLIVFSERFEGLGISTDKGQSWKRIDERFNGEFVVHLAFDKNTSGVLYALTHENALYKSGNAGETWKKIR